MNYIRIAALGLGAVFLACIGWMLPDLFDKAEVPAEPLIAEVKEHTPAFVVLHLNDRPVMTSFVHQSQVYLDMDGDGALERTGWVAPEGGILVRDRNQNGVVDGLSEIVHVSLEEAVSRGSIAPLDALNSNGDGLIDQRDQAFGGLKIWRDYDKNGKSEKDELKNFKQSGIVALKTRGALIDDKQEGITVSSNARYLRRGGFKRDPLDTRFNQGRVGLEGELTLMSFEMLNQRSIMPGDVLETTNNTGLAPKFDSVSSDLSKPDENVEAPKLRRRTSD